MEMNVSPELEISGKEEARQNLHSSSSSPSLIKLTELLAHIDASSKSIRSNPVRPILQHWIRTPDGMSTIEWLRIIDACCLQVVAITPCNEMHIHDHVIESINDVYGIRIHLHIVRKRLWKLRLKHVIVREENFAAKFYLHEKWKKQVLQALGAT